MSPHLSLPVNTIRRGASIFPSSRITSSQSRTLKIPIRPTSPAPRGVLFNAVSSSPPHLIGRFSEKRDEWKRRIRLYQAFRGDRFASTSNIDSDEKDSRANLQQRATESMRERASSMRETARGHYQGFRDHPAESARQGAKTFGGMLRQYGPVFLGTYMSVYFATLGGLFLGVESGALDPAGLFQLLGHADGDASGETLNTVKLVIDFMEQHELTAKYVHIVEKRPEVANLAVAWIAVKFTEPIRLAVSLAITPRIARYFGIQPKDLPSDASGETASDAGATSKDQASAP